MFDGQSVLITGGTGSFGRTFTRMLLDSGYSVERVVIFSRDELKQHEMRMSGFDDSRLRYFIGDVRDRNRLYRALNGIDTVIHAAALKQVPSCEYNPIEAVKTNIDGAANVIDAAIDTYVTRVIALSTDKAVNPINLYGATKLVAEKLFVQANSYSGGGTKFSCVRYGNVVGSRGSVIPLFKKQAEEGTITLTDARMTRFWITLEQAAAFVIKCARLMIGGEVFVPRIPSMRLIDLAEVVAPDSEKKTIGIRPGEKLHEVLVSEDESRNTLEFDDMYLIQPIYKWWDKHKLLPPAPHMEDGSSFSSDTNTDWLTRGDLWNMT